MTKLYFDREYDVHHYEVDKDGKIFIASIMNYLDDLAVIHADHVNVGIEYLKQNNIAWVIYKWDVKINKYAKVKDKLKVRTRPYSIRKFYAYRQYEIVNEEGEVIVSANSLWFLIDLKKRRPCKVNDYIGTQFGLGPDDNEQLEFEKLQEPKEIISERSFSVRYGDIDTNKHVNNVKYISWALESLPDYILESCSLKELKVNYEKETSYGEKVSVKCEVQEGEDNYIVNSMISNSAGEKLTLLKTVWQKN